jgi:hypothetical protein
MDSPREFSELSGCGGARRGSRFQSGLAVAIRADGIGKRKLDAFDEDHFGLRGGLPERFGGSVFGRVPPFAGDFS